MICQGAAFIATTRSSSAGPHLGAGWVGLGGALATPKAETGSIGAMGRSHAQWTPDTQSHLQHCFAQPPRSRARATALGSMHRRSAELIGMYSLRGSSPRPMAHKTITLTTELRELL